MFKCYYCNGDFYDPKKINYITIEKSYSENGELPTIFIDLCQQCFVSNADEKVINYSLREKKQDCIYCDKIILNNLGQSIVSDLRNETGKYCAVYKYDNHRAFMHIECYEKNIGI